MHICLHETHLITSDHENILVKRFHLLGYFESYLSGAFWLIKYSWTITYSLGFTNLTGIISKYKVFLFTGVYPVNDSRALFKEKQNPLETSGFMLYKKKINYDGYFNIQTWMLLKISQPFGIMKLGKYPISFV